jgi:regulatory Fis family protein
LAVTNQLTAVLVAGDPRGAADRTLAFLASLNKARGAAVFAVDGDRLTLFTGRGFGVEAVAAVQAAWTKERGRLEKGELWRASDAQANYLVAPLTLEGAVVALLYLDVAVGDEWSALDTSSITGFSVAIAQAVVAAASAPLQPSPVQAYLSQTSDDEIARERLLLLLVQNEWNISRVARLMGVTRRTIYLRLQRHSIVREKVRKTELPSRRKAWSPA